MMASSGEDNWPWEFGSAHRQKKKKAKEEQETAQPTAARFNKTGSVGTLDEIYCNLATVLYSYQNK